MVSLLSHFYFEGSVNHYCEDSNIQPNIVILKHRQIWADSLSCSEIIKDGKPLSSYEANDIPMKPIILTVIYIRLCLQGSLFF